MARTYFVRPDLDSADCALTDSGIESQLTTSQSGGNESDSHDVPQGSNANNYQAMSYVMPSGEIGGEDLAAGSVFSVVLDITVIGANLNVRVIFHAYDSGCNSIGSAAMDEADFTSTGLQTATVTWNPPANADRYGIEVHAGHGGMHNSAAETLTIRGNNANVPFIFPDSPGAPAPGGDQPYPDGTPYPYFPKRRLIPSGMVMTVNLLELPPPPLVQVKDESVNPTEDLVVSLELNRILDEVVNVSEDTVRSLELLRIEDEVETIDEAFNKTKLIVQAIDEIENITEELATALGKVKIFGEVVNSTDDPITALGKVKVVDDVLNLVEDISSTLGKVQIVSEVVNVGPSGVLDLQVGASADDVFHDSTHNFDVTDGRFQTGAGASESFDSTARFTGVIIPQGSTILVAHLILNPTGTQSGSSILTQIRAHLADNSPQITTDGEMDTVLAALTAAKTDWDNFNVTIDVPINSPSIVSVIQELVDRPGWGDTLTIVWRDDGSLSGDVRIMDSWDENNAQAPRIHIEFSVPEGIAVRVLNRILDELENVSEDVVRVQDLVRLLDETENVAEAVFSVRGLIRALSEQIQIQPETALVVLALNRILDETVDVVEVFNTVRGLVIVRDELLDIIEQVNELVEAGAGFDLVEIIDELNNIVELIDKTITVMMITDETVKVGAQPFVQVITDNGNDVRKVSNGFFTAAGNFTAFGESAGLTHGGGHRFTGVLAAKNQKVRSARIQFQSHNDNTGVVCRVKISAHAADDSAKITSAAEWDIVVANLTAASEPWTVPAWSTAERGPDTLTVDFAPVLEEIFARAGWNSGQAINVIIENDGSDSEGFRRAGSSELVVGNAAELTLELVPEGLAFVALNRIISEVMNVVEAIVTSNLIVRIKNSWIELHERILPSRELLRVEDEIENLVLDDPGLEVVTDNTVGVAIGDPTIRPLPLGTSTIKGLAAAVPGIRPRALGTVEIRVL